MPPLRTIATVAVAVVLAALATWAIAVLPIYRGLPLTARKGVRGLNGREQLQT